MADSKISGLPASTTPLTGAEVLPIVQGTTTKQVSITNVTAGRAVSALSLTSTNDASVNGLTVGKGGGAVATSTVLGFQALNSNVSSANNTTLGYQTGFAITGAQNTLLGANAGYSGINNLTTGSNNIIIGYNAAASSATVSNEVTIGNSSITATRLQGNLSVAGNAIAPWFAANTAAIDMSYTALSYDTSIGSTTISNNMYQSAISPPVWSVKTTNAIASSLYQQVNGEHIWQNGVAGAVGSTITRFTQMTLSTGGLLSIGSSSSSAGITLNSLQSSGGSANFNFCLVSTNTTTGRISGLREGASFATSLIFSTAAPLGTVTEALRIDSGQNVLLRGLGGLGYGTGSGGAVTQATSRTTGVTLNKTNGAITLVSAAGLATYQSFTVTNSTVAATDTIIVNQKSGTDKNIIFVTNVAAGSFEISLATTG